MQFDRFLCRAWCELTSEQSAECLSKSIEAMTLLAESNNAPIFLALTGASVSNTAKGELGLRFGSFNHF